MDDLTGAHRLLAVLSSVLAESPPDADAILTIATSTLSRFKPATWVGVVKTSNPRTSRVIVADEADPAMAQWVDAYIGAVSAEREPTIVGTSRAVIETGAPFVNPRMPYDQVVRTFSPDGQSFARIHPPPHQPRHVGLLVVPIRVGGATIGTLGAFDWTDQGRVEEGDLDWVAKAADRVAVFLERARLVRAARLGDDRRELIRSIALAAREGQSPSATIGSIVEQLVARLHVDAADVLLVGEDGKELALAASAGFRTAHPNDFPQAQFALGLHRPHVEHLADLECGAGNPRRSHLAGEGIQTVASFPLRVRNRLVGVLEIYNRGVVAWERDSLEYFETIAALAAILVDHARLAARPAGTDERGGAPMPGLSDLELEVLRLISDGLTNQEIAERVHRSANTVKFHVRRILEKTGSPNRTELARRATREGWI